MKKNILITSILLFAFIFTGCSDNNDPVPEPSIGKGYAALNLRIGEIKTKADPIAADPEEKEIRSIACFVQTYGEGSVGTPEYKEGSFTKYLSTEALKSDMGLEEPLTEVSEGIYTVTVRIRSEGFGGASDVVFIANYQNDDPAKDLTDELKALESWTELEDMTSKTLTASPEVPLLMYGSESVILREGQTSNQEFNMKRLASRIDVHYLETVVPPAEKKFELTSVQLINPKSSTYLLPHDEDDINTIPTVASFPEVTPSSSTPDEINRIYTYAVSNRQSSSGEETTKTQLRITGKYKKTLQVDKTIDFTDINGNSIPLAPNTRYLVQLLPPGDDQELIFNIKVLDWTEGGEIPTGPEQEKLTLENIAITPTAGGTWDVANHTYDITGVTSGGSFTFSVKGNCATDYEVISRYDSDASSLGLEADGALRGIVAQEAPETSYSPEGEIIITQNYEVQIPLQNDTEKVPVDVVVYIRSMTNQNNSDSIVFRSRPDYETSPGLKPVLFGGIYWAPVNVGASIITGELNLANMGYVYQWGRNGYGSEVIDDTSTPYTDIQAGPVSYAESVGTYSNKFIAGSNDWLITQDAYRATRDRLWSKNINESPCPPGWRVPRIDEMKKFVDTYSSANYEAGRYRYGITGDNGTDKLYIPLAGYRYYGDGSSRSRGVAAVYWSSSSNGGGRGGRLHIFASGSNVVYADYGYGKSIRCVQE